MKTASEPTTSTETTTENPAPTSTYDFGQIWNGIIINNQVIGIVISHATQDKVDTLVNEGLPSYYEVRRSERGEVSEDYSDIISMEQGDSIFLGSTGYAKTLRLITCSTEDFMHYRWVVIAENVG